MVKTEYGNLLTKMPEKRMLGANGGRYYQGLSNPLTRKVRLMRRERRYFTATSVAVTLGISKQTLLRYESRGIFPKANRNQVNGWREYTEEDIRTLRRILGR